MTFREKVEKKKAKVGVVGLGYVGLPLLLEFAEAGFVVFGIDIDLNKVVSLQDGKSYIRHISSEKISRLIRENDKATTSVDFAFANACDALLICVPTPLSDHREPELSYIRSTAELIGPHMREGQLICLESTTYPGTTEDVLIPILEEKSGLKAGLDFMVAYSPEREDPNNKKYSTSTIPKVVGGIDGASLDCARALYDAVICETVPVSSCRAAEATKLMENIFRSVNIALVNEMKTVLAAMDIDVWEVIEAAKTKPFGYMPFYPGPGLGGHCIPIDPFYLTWKAREYGMSTRFIELAGEINTAMPRQVALQTMLAANARGMTIRGAKVLIVGLAYKKNTDDDRESPAYALWEQFEQVGAEVSYYDPLCPEVRHSRQNADLCGRKSVSYADVRDFDVAVISTAHDCVDHDVIAELVPLVIDTRNACKLAHNVVKA